LFLCFSRKVFDGSWGWRALRLLAKKSPHFFTFGNHPISKLPDYLDTMLRKLCKEHPFNLSESAKALIASMEVKPLPQPTLSTNSSLEEGNLSKDNDDSQDGTKEAPEATAEAEKEEGEVPKTPTTPTSSSSVPTPIPAATAAQTTTVKTSKTSKSKSEIKVRTKK
jgi:hypothetical protein